jgi:hypothetical protein
MSRLGWTRAILPSGYRRRRNPIPAPERQHVTSPKTLPCRESPEQLGQTTDHDVVKWLPDSHRRKGDNRLGYPDRPSSFIGSDRSRGDRPGRGAGSRPVACAVEQRVARQSQFRPEVVWMPLQRVVERDALAEEALAMVNEQPRVCPMFCVWFVVTRPRRAARRRDRSST